MKRTPILMLSALIAACSPVRVFNAAVPHDRNIVQVERGAAYGDHPRHRIDVYRPTSRADSSPRLPVIVFFYGGSWQEGDRAAYAFAARAFASRGFLVAVPDYRLVPEVRFPAFLEDGASALRWVRANAARLGGDPDRLVLVGHSAGAYNAAMLALDERWLGPDKRAIRAFIGIAGPYDFLPLDTPASTAAFGQESDLARTQPVNFASADDPPVLLLHGARDTTVYPRNSERLSAALRDVGVVGETILYPRVGHVGILTALARPFRKRAPVLDDAAAFAHRVTRTKR